MKKVLVILFAIILFINPVFAENEYSFADLEKYGITDKEADYDGSVSRYDCVEMVVHLSGLTSLLARKKFWEYWSRHAAFEDVIHYYNACITFAKEKWIVFGTEGGAFEGDRNATYKEAVAFAMRINAGKQCGRDAELDVLF